MEILSKEDLRQLWSNTSAPCVSLYLPAHRAGAGTQQDLVRLRNLMREAESGLRASGRGRGEISKLLAPARELLDDREFWRRQSDGLAILSSPAISRLYRLRLPVPEVAVTSDRFHLRPLLASLAADWQYYVLGLSQSQVRVFQATRDSIVELNAPNLPARLAATLRGRIVGQQSPFAYFQAVDQGMADLLSRNNAPIVLAAVDFINALYREVNTSAALLEDWIPIAPEELSPEQVHEKAASIASAAFAKEQAKAIDQYSQLWFTGRTANTLADILPAAHQGRVQSLFVASGVQVWGLYDEARQRTAIFDEPAAQDQDLLNLAAVQTLLTRGSVYAVEPWEMPGGGAVAAVFRY